MQEKDRQIIDDTRRAIIKNLAECEDKLLTETFSAFLTSLDEYAKRKSEVVDWMDDHHRAERFVSIACDTWDADQQQPVCSPMEFTRMAAAADRIRASLYKFPKLNPYQFQRYWREVLGRTINCRPDILLDNWIGYVKWEKGRGRA